MDALPGGRAPGRQRIPDGSCLRCGGPVVGHGVEEFRTGGTSGGWKLRFGELAELGEGMVRFELMACRECGHVEFRLPSRQ